MVMTHRALGVLKNLQRHFWIKAWLSDSKLPIPRPPLALEAKVEVQAIHGILCVFEKDN